jgi:hypothetical protein
MGCLELMVRRDRETIFMNVPMGGLQHVDWYIHPSAVLIGALTGLFPAMKAGRMSPTEHDVPAATPLTHSPRLSARPRNGRLAA